MKWDRHGMYGTRIYTCWQNMKNRCNNPSHPSYQYYGLRGIGYDDRWEEFKEFYADMGEMPEGKELERRENSKGYNKDNCRWATEEEQSNNKGLRKDSKTGVKGVSVQRSGRYFAQYTQQGRTVTLYCGHDFFEAVCCRKSWEATT